MNSNHPVAPYYNPGQRFRRQVGVRAVQATGGGIRSDLDRSRQQNFGRLASAHNATTNRKLTVQQASMGAFDYSMIWWALAFTAASFLIAMMMRSR